MNYKELAAKAEDEFDFAKALEYYEKALDELSIEDGSLQRYANLLFEFQEYQKAKTIFETLVKETSKAEYLEKLAQIYEELQMNEQAIAIYEQLGQAKKVKELKQQKKSQIQIDTQVIKRFLELFTGREDVFAVQTDEGYRPIRMPMTERDVFEHLSGEKTLGAYVLRSDNCIKFAAFDVDFNTDAPESYSALLGKCMTMVRNLSDRLKLENISHHVEFSGNRGYHIWIFFDRWLQAYKVRYILKKISQSLETVENVSVEIFPKQSETGGGLGNLIKLPLGVHRKTSSRCPFVDENFQPIANQFEYLLTIQPNDAELFEKLYKEYSEEQESLQPIAVKTITTDKNPTAPTKKLIKQQIKPMEKFNVFDAMINACYPLKQIREKIEKLAFISEDEEYILAAACVALEGCKEYPSGLLKKTINYSAPRPYSLLNRIGTVPISCEEIKRLVLSKSLSLSIDQCNCKFEGTFNTPACLVGNYPYLLLPKLNVRDIVRKIMDKTKEKAELENQIRTLKNLLAEKMTQDEIVVDNVIVKKDNGEIKIII